MKLAVFYHCILSGGSRPIDTEVALNIMEEQMGALKQSGLMEEAKQVYVGVNGDTEDGVMAGMIAGNKPQIITHGKGATTEIPTMKFLRDWLPGHEDWFVLYHHIKGVGYPKHPLYAAWRRCMEKTVVWNWKNCVHDLQSGFDSVGTHWLIPEEWVGRVKSPFWGGTFWWATAKFLSTLPPLPPPTWANRFEAENWIGRGKRRPVVHDYHPGWPSMKCL